jgi:hypothetical protein
VSLDQTKPWELRNSDIYQPPGERGAGRWAEDAGRHRESALEQVAGIVYHLSQRLQQQAQRWKGLSQPERVETILTILREI